MTSAQQDGGQHSALSLSPPYLGGAPLATYLADGGGAGGHGPLLQHLVLLEQTGVHGPLLAGGYSSRMVLWWRTHTHTVSQQITPHPIPPPLPSIDRLPFINFY